MANKLSKFFFKKASRNGKFLFSNWYHLIIHETYEHARIKLFCVLKIDNETNKTIKSPIANDKNNIR